MITSAAAVVH